MNDSLKHFELGKVYVPIAWRTNQSAPLGVTYFTSMALDATVAITYGEPMLCVGSMNLASQRKYNIRNVYAVFLTRTPSGESVEVIAGDASHVFECFNELCG
jgi:hypothetical protein